MTKLPNIDSIFYPNCVTKSQSEGLAEGSIHPYSGRKPVHLLRIISCSKACKVPGSYILLYNAYCSSTLRDGAMLCAIYRNSMFFDLSDESAGCFVLRFFPVLVGSSIWCIYLEDLTREAYFSDSSCFDIVTFLFCFTFLFLCKWSFKNDITVPVHKSAYQYQVWPCC